MVIAFGFARIWHLYEANRCHELTCCLIKEARQSSEPANRMDGCRDACYMGGGSSNGDGCRAFAANFAPRRLVVAAK